MSLVFLVHGYSVWKSTAYGELAQALEKAGYTLREVFLGRYITLDDEVQIRDLAQAMHTALAEQLPPQAQGEFHIITHSTGALVAKQWVSRHYAKTGEVQGWRLGNLIFLAGPHFGSRLAHHGRSVINEVRLQGDPGRGVLTALELGSTHSWEINHEWAEHDAYRGIGVRPYCLIGDKARKDLLRFVSLFREDGSDEVVRVASGNLNFRHYTFDLTAQPPFEPLAPDFAIAGVPFVALKRYIHSGGAEAIMDGIRARGAPPPLNPPAAYADDNRLNLQLILSLLAVTDAAGYARQRQALAALNATPAGSVTAYAQLQFRLRDHAGEPVDDFYIEFAEQYKGGYAPTRAIAHTHRNGQQKNIVTFFVDTKQLTAASYQLRVTANSGSPLIYFDPSEAGETVDGVARRQMTITTGIAAQDVLAGTRSILAPNSTTQIDLTLSRQTLPWLFRFSNAERAEGIDSAGKPVSLDYPVGWDREGRIKKV